MQQVACGDRIHRGAWNLLAVWATTAIDFVILFLLSAEISNFSIAFRLGLELKNARLDNRPTLQGHFRISHWMLLSAARAYSYIDVDKIVGPFSLVIGLQDRWQPMREDQLALRTNDRWLPEGKRPRTNEK